MGNKYLVEGWVLDTDPNADAPATRFWSWHAIYEGDLSIDALAAASKAAGDGIRCIRVTWRGGSD